MKIQIMQIYSTEDNLCLSFKLRVVQNIIDIVENKLDILPNFSQNFKLNIVICRF